MVADADARARMLAADLPALQAVLERVEAEDGPDSRLRYWAYAMLAERLLLDADPDAVTVAGHALLALDDQALPPLPPLALRYARARLRRVASAAWLLAPGTDRAALRDLLHQSVNELLACGFVGEVHATRGLAAGSRPGRRPRTSSRTTPTSSTPACRCRPTTSRCGRRSSTPC